MTTDHFQHAPQYGQGAMVQGQLEQSSIHTVPLPCENCATINWLPSEVTDRTRWECKYCAQPQSVHLAQERASSESVSILAMPLLTNPMDSGEPACEEQECIRPVDHSGKHRNSKLEEWERKPSSSSTRPQVTASHISAHTPVDPANPIPGRRS
jgi:hypothetical protein